MDTSVVPNRLDLSVLNPEQSAGVVHGDGPLLILAGAGTGKTRVITYRIARLIEAGAPPDRILAVTFTNKAAGEMRRRIEALSPGAGARVWAHTFHAFAARLLRRHHEALGLNPRFTVYDQDDQKKTVVEAMKELGLQDQKNKAGMYVAVISRAKDDLLDAGSYGIYAAAGPDPFRQTAARIYAAYQRKLDAAGCLDFGDLLLKSCELLKTHPEIRGYYQELFLHVLVDEYQDTNHAQYILTKTLADKHRNLCVVGDDDQSVYSWRGANIRNILEFERDFPNTRVVKLEQNYRSTPRILEAATSVIHNNKARKAKTLWTEQAGGDMVEARELANETEEARWAVNTICGLSARGRSFSDFAVFYRTNAQSRSFEEALRAARVPYVIVGAHRFYERKEIKDALAYARTVVNPRDSAALSRILNVPPRGIGKTSQELFQLHAQSRGLALMDAFRREEEIPKLTTASRLAVSEMVAMIDRLRAETEGMPPGQALARVLQESGYWSWLEGEIETDPEAAGRLSNLQELLNAAKEFEERLRSADGGPPMDLGRYLEEVSLQSDIDAYDSSQPLVTLMTVHLAKGLEFPVVFLTGLEEGLFPIGAGGSPADMEEERRLCYVGITRARERLYLTHAATRRMFGNVYSNLPSRFILEAKIPTEETAIRNGNYDGNERNSGISAPTVQGAQTASRAWTVGVRVGMRVRHPEFGAGSVVDKAGTGEAAKVTVRFDNGRSAKLLLRYAPLEPA